MQRITNALRTIGASDDTIQFALKVIIVGITLFGVTALGLDVYQVINGQAPSGWASTIVGAVSFFFVIVFTQAHTASTINGTATKTAVTQSQTTVQPLIDQNAKLNEQQLAILNAMIVALQKSQDNQVSQTTANTQAVQANTVATQANTEKQ